jgi:Methyltransferase FkbM domain
VAERAGERVTLAISAHQSSSGIADSGEIRDVRGTEVVPTLTLDDVVATNGADTNPLIVKLDIEGAEIAALHGGRKLLESDALLLYEDHGKDPESRVSAAVLELGWTVFLGGSEGFSQTDLSGIRGYKARPNVAYNLIACRNGSGMEEEVRNRLATRTEGAAA